MAHCVEVTYLVLSSHSSVPLMLVRGKEQLDGWSCAALVSCSEGERQVRVGTMAY